jgi:hypothetical protein
MLPLTRFCQSRGVFDSAVPPREPSGFRLMWLSRPISQIQRRLSDRPSKRLAAAVQFFEPRERISPVDDPAQKS